MYLFFELTTWKNMRWHFLKLIENFKNGLQDSYGEKKRYKQKIKNKKEYKI